MSIGATEVVPSRLRITWGRPHPGVRSSEARRCYKCAAGIASPDAVRGPAVKADVIAERMGAVENLAGAFLGRRIIDNQFDPFVPSQMADDLCVDPGNGVKL